MARVQGLEKVHLPYEFLYLSLIITNLKELCVFRGLDEINTDALASKFKNIGRLEFYSVL